MMAEYPDRNRTISNSDVLDFADSLGVFIVHFGEPSRSQVALRCCLELQHRPAGVYVIDNSDNWPADWASEGEEVISAGENLGYAGAVNLAADIAQANDLKYIWILNNDVTVSSDAMAYFAEAFLLAPDADIVGSYVSNGDLCYFGGGEFDRKWGRPAHSYSRTPIKVLPIGGPVGTDWINGASMVIPLSAFKMRGPFDPWLFLYKEELEWQIRSPEARCFLIRRALVDHEVGATTGSSGGPVGAAFMARNGLLIARRQIGDQEKLRWTMEVLRVNLLYPLVKRETGRFFFALSGVCSLRVPPKELLRRVLILSRQNAAK